jgi:hypothetical protein
MSRARHAEEEMNYLREHPTSMPINEAAMTYLFEQAPALSLVTSPGQSAIERDQEREAVLKSA